MFHSGHRPGIGPPFYRLASNIGRMTESWCDQLGTQNLISDVDRAEWEAAVLEYRAKHGDGDSNEDEENEWF